MPSWELFIRPNAQRRIEAPQRVAATMDGETVIAPGVLTSVSSPDRPAETARAETAGGLELGS